jgi:Kef-type K+ transport system membrane component KefB
MTTELMIVVLLVGSAVLLSALMRSALGRLGLPAIPGFILLGLGIRALDTWFPCLPEQGHKTIEFLAEVGVFALLFHIGVESNLKQLLSQLGRASLIGFFSIVASGVLGFVATLWLLGQNTPTSLFVGAAMVATSVGVAAGVWEDAGAIQTDEGQLLLDIAEFDDVAGVVIMALLFAVGPVLDGGSDQTLLPVLSRTAIVFAAKLLVFGATCVVFAHYIEKPLMDFFRKFEKAPEETLTVVAIGLIIAAVAGLLGFSIAVGAFFAGLIFSRDPQSLKSRTAFNAIYDFFAPFFFIGIGVRMHVESLGPALAPAVVLITVAFAGKFLGAVMPALSMGGTRPAVLLGLSMIPRAEVAMIISQRAVSAERAAMPEAIYSALVITSLTSCLLPPVVLKRLIGRWIGGTTK